MNFLLENSSRASRNANGFARIWYKFDVYEVIERKLYRENIKKEGELYDDS